MTGFSSSLSIGWFVLWTHVLVQRCRSLTYEFLTSTIQNTAWLIIYVLNQKSQGVRISLYLGTSESPPLRVVGSSSKIDDMSLPSGTDTSVYITLSWGLRACGRITSCSESSCEKNNWSAAQSRWQPALAKLMCWNESNKVKKPSNGSH